MGELGKKVIVELTVGLGNQLFQYALARHLSIINDADLYFDLSRSKMDAASYDMRNNVFDLGKFKIEGKVWDGHNLDHDKKTFRVQKLLFGEKFKVIKEEHFVYDDSVFEKTNKSIYLLGFWQSEKYFKPISKRLKDELQFKDGALEGVNEKVQDEILSTNAVAIHVRRADYVDDEANSKIYSNIFNEGYYLKAIKKIEKLIENPTYFVFSDDIKWCKEYFKLHTNASVQYVENQSEFADFHLMSKCNHNIIANSTFSWWSAWLNNSPSKVVISPKKWFLNEWDDSNIPVDNWVKI